MGVARSLFQASEDRLIPKFFAHTNKHHVPDRAMFFNLICAMIVALLGSPVRIYIFSNVGYLLAIIAALFGYFMVRQFRKDQIGPFRMPGFFRWIALLMALSLTFVYFAGGWGSPDIVVGPGSGSHPLHPRLRRRGRLRAAAPLAQVETDRRDGVAPLGELPIVVGSPGGIDLDDMREPHVLDPDHMDAIDAEAAGIHQIPDTAPEAG